MMCSREPTIPIGDGARLTLSYVDVGDWAKKSGSKNRPSLAIFFPPASSLLGQGVGLRLLVLTAETDPPPRVLIKGRKAVVGRSADCDVRLPDPSVSLHHATIRKRGDSYLLFDEGSSHGTGIGTTRDPSPVWLPPNSPRLIEDGAHLWFGQIEVLAQFGATKRGEPSGYEELAPTLVEAGLRTAGLTPTSELIESTLAELTQLEDELFEEREEELPEPVGAAALEAEDRHPPWVTDTLVAAIALTVFAGCVVGLAHLAGFT